MCLTNRSKITESSLTKVSLCKTTDIVCINVGIDRKMWNMNSGDKV